MPHARVGAKRGPRPAGMARLCRLSYCRSTALFLPVALVLLVVLVGCGSSRQAKRSRHYETNGWYVYEVKSGDTLAKISRMYGISIERIQRDNHIRDPRSMKVGQRLRIREGGRLKGVKHRIRRGETVAALSRRYGATILEIAQANNLRDPGNIRAGTVLLVPYDPLARQPARIASSGSSNVKTAGYKPGGRILRGVQLAWPVKQQFVLTSGFGPRWGRMHNGIDLAQPKGSPIYAAAAGVVAMAGGDRDAIGRTAGKYVILRHRNGVKTLYFHNDRVLVRAGQRVRQGQVIARMGNTGRVVGRTGVHLHFEVRDGVKPVNPLRYLPKKP